MRQGCYTEGHQGIQVQHFACQTADFSLKLKTDISVSSFPKTLLQLPFEIFMWSLASCWYTAESFVPVAFSLQPCHLHHYCRALSWWRAASSYLNSMPGVTRLSLYWLKLCDSYFTSISITDPWGSHVEPTCCVLKKHLVSSWAPRYDLNPYSADFCFAGSGINNANVNNLVFDAKGNSNMKHRNKPKWWFHSHVLLVINV